MPSPASPAVSEVQIQLWPLHLRGVGGHETTDHANGPIHSKGAPQMCNYLTSPRLISPTKRLGKQGRQNSVAFQQFHCLSEFSQTSLENTYLTCRVIPRCIPQECHASISLVLIYLDKSQNYFPRINFSQMLSSIESKKVGSVTTLRVRYSQLWFSQKQVDQGHKFLELWNKDMQMSRCRTAKIPTSFPFLYCIMSV